MKKVLNRTDVAFLIALSLCLLFFYSFLSAYPFARDEAFYLTVPFRLINGDSLVSHEWHLTQFSSLFSYLPTLIWIKITGSTEGILVFSRAFYLFIQTILTTTVYIFFRKKYKIWSVVAAILFFTQGTNIMLQISYHTMLMSLLMLFTLTILLIYTKQAAVLYIFAGFFYGACCVCDPSFCVVFLIYIIFCALWKYKNSFVETVADFKVRRVVQKSTSSKNKKKNNSISENTKQKMQTTILQNIEPFDCFFTKKAFICIFIGILLIAVIAVSFFFSTGGTISSIFENIDNLLSSSEYTSQGSFFMNIIRKIENAIYDFKSLSFDNAFFLLVMFVLILTDKKRTTNSHRCIYLIASLSLAVIYAVGIYRKFSEEIYFVEFPFFIFALVSYTITQNKNKRLFYCMWLPGAIAAVIHLLSSSSLLSAVCIVLIINNTAGVFFVSDLFKEMSSKQNGQKNEQLILKISHSVLSVALCCQLIFHLLFFQSGLFISDSEVKATVGPYYGINMTDNQFNNYTKTIVDLDIIKDRVDEDTPIYIVSYQSCWMYLYINQPIAVHTAYYLDIPEKETLQAYYKENPDRIPKYIYVDFLDYYQNNNQEMVVNNIEALREMFTFTEEPLSNGMLLKVTGYNLLNSGLIFKEYSENQLSQYLN